MCSPAAPKLSSIKIFMPYITKSLNSGIIMGTADILSQTCVEKRDWSEIQKRRTIKYALIGVFFTGPLLARWSRIKHKSLSKYATPLTESILKTLDTQIFLAPTLNFGIITLAGVLNGIELTKANLWNILHKDFLNIMEKNYMIWLPAQFTGCIIRCSMLKFCITNCVSILWFAYLSSVLMAKH